MSDESVSLRDYTEALLKCMSELVESNNVAMLKEVDKARVEIAAMREKIADANRHSAVTAALVSLLTALVVVMMARMVA